MWACEVCQTQEAAAALQARPAMLRLVDVVDTPSAVRSYREEGMPVPDLALRVLSYHHAGDAEGRAVLPLWATGCCLPCAA